MSEEDYDGGEDCRLWFGARTNCLWLGDRQRGEERERCAVCQDQVVEDLQHFLLECRGVEEARAAAVELQRPRGENDVETMGEFLFGDEGGWCSRRRKMGILRKMWRMRRSIISE